MRIALIIAASAISTAALAAVLATVLATAPAGAGESERAGAPAEMTPGLKDGDQSSTTAPRVNHTDRQFALKASMSGKAEVEQAQIAGRKGSDPSVKHFAHLMERDHSATNKKLKTVAEALNLPLSNKLNKEHQAGLDRLEKTANADFDKIYMRNVVENHQKTVQLLEWVIGQGQNRQLQQFAVETLPVALDHLEKARLTEAKVTGRSSYSEPASSNDAKEQRASNKNSDDRQDRRDRQIQREKKERQDR